MVIIIETTIKMEIITDLIIETDSIKIEMETIDLIIKIDQMETIDLVEIDLQTKEELKKI